MLVKVINIIVIIIESQNLYAVEIYLHIIYYYKYILNIDNITDDTKNQKLVRKEYKRHQKLPLWKSELIAVVFDAFLRFYI